jgi:hypothetical protein
VFVVALLFCERLVCVCEQGQEVPHRGINQGSLTRLYVEWSEDESLGTT